MRVQRFVACLAIGLAALAGHSRKLAADAPSVVEASDSDAAGVASCCDGCANACGACDCLGCGSYGGSCDDGPVRLFDNCWLDRHNIKIGGWINGGFTWNPDSPANRYNVPVTFQDRANEGQMNQLYLFAQRELNTECGFDFGGRVDLLYGTDYFYTTALGLETRSDGSQHWNRNKFGDPVRRAGAQYGLAMPQLYAEFGFCNLSVKVGHYYAPVGYQTVTAPDNFFITQPYTFQYGEPFTLTGALATYKMNEQLSLFGGIDRGWDRFEDDNENLSALGGFRWTSDDESTVIAWSGTVGEERGISGLNGSRVMSSFVLTRKLTDRWQYVFQNDIGWQDDAALVPFGGGILDSEWYGINQYLFYTINDCWQAGARFEWFRDDDGTRVRFFDNLSDNEGHYFETALGLSFRPNSNLTIRSEARWDWSDASLPPSAGTGFPRTIYPYDDLGHGSQFIWTTDLIVKF